MEFFACLNDQCLGGGRCAEHYTGFACTECDGDGLVLNTDYSCSQCLSKALTVFCILCAIAAYILYIIYSVESSREVRYSLKGVFYKILATTLQVNCIALSYSFNWSAYMDMFLKAQGSVSSLGTAYLSLACLQKSPSNTFLLETVLYLWLPLILLFLPFLFSVVHGWYVHPARAALENPWVDAPFLPLFVRRNFIQKEKEKAKRQDSQTHEQVDIELTLARRFDMSESRRWNYSKNLPGIFFVILFLLQPTLVNRFALLFSCVKIGEVKTLCFVLLFVVCSH